MGGQICTIILTYEMTFVSAEPSNSLDRALCGSAVILSMVVRSMTDYHLPLVLSDASGHNIHMKIETWGSRMLRNPMAAAHSNDSISVKVV